MIWGKRMKYQSIPVWIKSTYGDDPSRPAVKTVRAWCREGHIYPMPRKHGRAYMLHPRACYVDPTSPASVRAAKEYVNDTKAA